LSVHVGVVVGVILVWGRRSTLVVRTVTTRTKSVKRSP